MASRQVKDIQRRQTKPQPQNQSHPRRQPQTQTQDVRRQHGDKEGGHFHGHGRADGFPNQLGCCVQARSCDLNRGHSTKHRICPMRHLALLRLEISRFFGHADVVLDVPLTEAFVLEHGRRHQESRHQKHRQHRHGMRQQRWQERTQGIGGRHKEQVTERARRLGSILQLFKINVFPFFGIVGVGLGASSL